MKRVFVDTGGFVALLVAEDEMHPKAGETPTLPHSAGPFSILSYEGPK